MAISVLSEVDVIKCWLDTPAGYYKGTDNFGFDPNIILFKNMSDAKIRLSRVLDKLIYDLGWDIAININSIDLLTDDKDEVRLAINYNNQAIISRNYNEKVKDSR